MWPDGAIGTNHFGAGKVVSRVRLALLAGAIGLAPNASAQQPRITSLSPEGRLSWTNVPEGAVARVDWAPQVAGPWRSNWLSLENLVPTNGGGAADVPRFFRVAAITNPPPLSGANLAGWTVALGDAVYAAPGVAAASLDDLETVHTNGCSELRANLDGRRIMAHNITYQRVSSDAALSTVHRCGYSFRLPYLPVPDPNATLNAETVEGGVFVWDGAGQRLDFGVAFQWLLNPWGNFGTVQCWRDLNGGSWQPVGTLKPDTTWHRVEFVLDLRNHTTALILDGEYLPSAYSSTPKPADWSSTTEARLQVEIVSVYPGPTGRGALHRAQIKDWFWTWE